MMQKLKNYPVSFVKVIFGYSLYITLIFNYPLVRKLNNFFDISPGHLELFEYFFFFLVILTILSLLSILLFILGTRYLLKPLVLFLLMSSAIITYYKNTYGISVDEGIIASLFDAIVEGNLGEIRDLLNIKLFLLVLITALIPSLPLFFIKIEYPKIMKEYVLRFSYTAGMIVILLGLIASNYKDVSLTARANKQLNQDAIPLYSVSSLFNVIKHSLKAKRTYTKLDEQPALLDPEEEIVGVVIVGETARADHFSLNGYPRKTNPNLEKKNIVNYSDAYSCETLTKVSVPCMFYLGNYDSYREQDARYKANLLDVISKASADVTWVENNSGCKHICDRVKLIDLTKILNKENYDEKLLPILDKILKNNKRKRILIVLHAMGSHGPKYFERYPSEFDKFKPSCKSNNPQECSRQDLINTFDNTILYTDHFVNLVIEKLEQQKKKSFLIYASDHGESLGEHGLYLHGVPRKFAPKEQIHIPWILWFSDLYKESRSFKTLDVKTTISHEYYPHTILDAMKIKSKYFKKEKSLIQ